MQAIRNSSRVSSHSWVRFSSFARVERHAQRYLDVNGLLRSLAKIVLAKYTRCFTKSEVIGGRLPNIRALKHSRLP